MTTEKVKQTEELNESLASDELPDGWARVTLRDVTESVPNVDPKSEPDRDFGYIDISSIDNRECRILGVKRYLGKNAPSRARRPIRPGDILFSNVRTYLRNIAMVPADCAAQLCSTGFTVIRSNGAVNPSYLFYYSLTDGFIAPLTEQQTGSNYPATCDRIVLSSQIEVAPLAEQNRIVSKVEELLAEVNRVRARLEKVAKILKAFRQSVLTAACSGRLTEDWREKNPNNSNVDTIIEAIRRRREAETNSAAQKEKLRHIYEYRQENDSTELPERWRFAALNKLCVSFDYGTSAKSQPSGTMPVLRMGNIQNGKIDWADLVFTSDQNEVRRYSLQPDTVLFNRTNSPELVGKTAIYRGERPAIFAGYLIRIVQGPELDPHYLNLCLNTSYARQFCSRVKSDGVSQSNINAQKLGTFEIPYCPLNEQHEIVHRVEALFEFADKIERQVESATKRAEKITQAILAKAFRGELVPTEAELAGREGRP